MGEENGAKRPGPDPWVRVTTQSQSPLVLALLGLAILLLEVSFKKDKKKDKGELEALKQELERMKSGEEP